MATTRITWSSVSASRLDLESGGGLPRLLSATSGQLTLRREVGGIQLETSSSCFGSKKTISGLISLVYA